MLRTLLGLVALCCLLPSPAAADVRALGPATGPAGLVVTMSFPACPTQAGEWSRIQLVNAPFGGSLSWGDQFPGGFGGAGTPGTLGDGPSTGTLTTTDTWFGSPEFPVGTHQLRFACQVYSQTLGVRTLWEDAGFALTITAKSRVTPVDQTAVTPGMTVSTSAGAPGGPEPCPSLLGVTWTRVFVYFYDGGSPYVLVGRPEALLAFANRFYRQVSPSATPGGSQVAIHVTCDASNAQFEWRTAKLDIVPAAASGDGCSYGPRRPGDTNCDGKVRAVVMGDSYISGEGGATSAQPYLRGSDSGSGASKDLCHRSSRSWAVQAAARLAPSAPILDPIDSGIPGGSPTVGDKIWFLACSGAVTADLDGVSPQYPPEGKTQLELLSALPGDVDIVFLSLGGNDARFTDVIIQCLSTACAADSKWREELLDNMQRVGERVAEVAIKVRRAAPGAELYHIGYPDPLRPTVPEPCGSLGSTAIDASLAAYVPKFGGGYTAVGPKSVGVIDEREQRWISGTFLTRLNARVRATTVLSGAHFIDVADRFQGSGVCSAAPLVHGLTGGDDEKVVIGHESFHPSPTGHDALLEAVEAEYGTRFGANPNPPAAELSHGEKDFLEIRVVGPDPDTDVFTASSGGYVIIKDGPPNTVIVVPTFSIGTAAGRALTDADGNATIPIRIPPTAGPGLHHLELMTEDGESLGSALFVVATPTGCTGVPDADGDGLSDVCDGDATDGPGADLDRDGVTNALDTCPVAPDAAQADADDDGRGDACDRDQGANPFGTRLHAGLVPPPPLPAAPTAPQAVALSVSSARATWAPPPEADGVLVTGYRVTVIPGGQEHTVGPDARSLDVNALPPGSSQRFLIRALSDGGAGPPAASQPVTLSDAQTPEPTATATPTASPSPSGEADRLRSPAVSRARRRPGSGPLLRGFRRRPSSLPRRARS